MIELASILLRFTILYRTTFDTNVVLLLLLSSRLIIYLQSWLGSHAIVLWCCAPFGWAIVLLSYCLLYWTVRVLAQGYRCWGCVSIHIDVLILVVHGSPSTVTHYVGLRVHHLADCMVLRLVLVCLHARLHLRLRHHLTLFLELKKEILKCVLVLRTGFVRLRGRTAHGPCVCVIWHSVVVNRILVHVWFFVWHWVAEQIASLSSRC